MSLDQLNSVRIVNTNTQSKYASTVSMLSALARALQPTTVPLMPHINKITKCIWITNRQ